MKFFWGKPINPIAITTPSGAGMLAIKSMYGMLTEKSFYGIIFFEDYK